MNIDRRQRWIDRFDVLLTSLFGIAIGVGCILYLLWSVIHQ
jgi:hypothetical protein